MATPVRQRTVGGVVYGNRFASAEVFWDDSPLQRAGVRAFVDAGRQAGGFARTKSPSRAVARSIGVRFYSGGAATGMDIAGIIRARSPLAHLFEKGTDPHPIAPKGSLQGLIALGRSRPGLTVKGNVRRVSSRGKNVAMKFPDGGFARGSVQHPGMQARPFLLPAAAVFPRLYHAALSRYLRF